MNDSEYDLDEMFAALLRGIMKLRAECPSTPRGRCSLSSSPLTRSESSGSESSSPTRSSSPQTRMSSTPPECSSAQHRRKKDKKKGSWGSKMAARMLRKSADSHEIDKKPSKGRKNQKSPSKSLPKKFHLNRVHPSKEVPRQISLPSLFSTSIDPTRRPLTKDELNKQNSERAERYKVTFANRALRKGPLQMMITECWQPLFILQPLSMTAREFGIYCRRTGMPSIYVTVGMPLLCI